MISRRVERAVRAQFAPGEVPALLDVLGALRLPFLDDDPDGTERVQAAVVLVAAGRSDRFLDAAALAETDWRDVLVAADLADQGWRERLREAFDASADDEPSS